MREPFIEFVENQLNFKALIITCGLPGTWKTETAAEISKIKGYRIFRSDIVRLEVLKTEDIFDPKIASNMNKRMAVYNELFRQAEDFISTKKETAILDATFVTQGLREKAAKIAVNHNMVFLILQTSCSEEASINRIMRRTKENYESNALTAEAYQNNKKKFEPVEINSLKKLNPDLKIIHLTVETEYDSPEKWYFVDIKKL
ncbi:MAG TPA: ATP-binding protein [Candidatus Glassbacteria bacterium]|nr:ATP-binding protein [Candidatus Glassbacteria bacterium]